MTTDRIPEFSCAKIMVLGDLMLDRYLIGSSHRISPEAPVPVLKVEQQKDQLGGAANVALNLAMLGCEVMLSGICGQDEAGESMSARLHSAGVGFLPIQPSDAITTIKQRIVCQAQQMLRVDFEEEMSDCTPQLLSTLEEHIENIQLLVLSDYAKGVLIRAEEFIELANDNDTPVFIDPKGSDFDRYRGASLLTPNIHEFERVAGACVNEQDMVDRGMAMIDRLQLDALLITRGDKGMTLLARDDVCVHSELHIPTVAHEVYDVTGAGDTVIATLAGACASGWSIDDAAILANQAAALVVARTGTSAVSTEELRLRVTSGKRSGTGVVNEGQLLSLVDECRRQGQKLVMTNGCFDVIHAGHVGYLEQASQLGDKLIVLVNDDQSIRRNKGSNRPINSLDRRMRVLAGLGAVDWVTSFADDNPRRLIELIQPDVLVKGGDYGSIEEVVGFDIVQSYGGTIHVLDHVDGVSSSSIIKALSASE